MQAALSKTLFTVGGQAVTGGGILTGVSMLQSVKSGYAQEAAMKAQAQGVKEQANMEKLKAQEESNLRRERLLNALAAQNVKAGAGGVKGGTTEQLKLQSTKEFEREQEGADLMSQAQQSGLERKAAGMQAQGKQMRRQSLISTGLKMAEIG